LRYRLSIRSRTKLIDEGVNLDLSVINEPDRVQLSEKDSLRVLDLLEIPFPLLAASVSKTNELQLECMKRGLRYVGTRGTVDAPVCFIGEAPGKQEDKDLQPFKGAAGDLLEETLDKAKVDKKLR
jgi:hypothetical protein